MSEYEERAKEFGCQFRLGKYGFNLLPSGLPGMRRRLLQVIPLDGWITDPNKIKQAIVDDGGSVKYGSQSHD